jgi:hypothetical protein
MPNASVMATLVVESRHRERIIKITLCCLRVNVHLKVLRPFAHG